MTRLLLLTQWFEPEPTFKGLAFAKELKKQGFEVEVVTGFPNYPGGKIYSGYRIKWYQKEIIDDITVHRVPLYPSHDRSSISRVFNYVSFAVSSLFYLLFFSRNIDVIYAYHPPLTVGLAAAVYKKIRNIKMVLDVQDLWPDTLRATGMISNKNILKIVGFFAKKTYDASDKIVVLSEGFKERLIQRGVGSNKIKVIKNWADEEKIKSNNEIMEYDPEHRDYFNILFAGNIGSAQALNSIIEAAVNLKKKASKIRFVFIGKGLDLNKLKNTAANFELRNVLFLPAVEMEKVGQYLRAADALLVHLRNDELFEITIPSKIQAYMVVGKPILLAVKGDASKLILEAKCGVLAEPENPTSISCAALELENLTVSELQQLGVNGKNYYDKQLSLKVGVEKFSKVFREVCDA